MDKERTTMIVSGSFDSEAKGILLIIIVNKQGIKTLGYGINHKIRLKLR